ncbi:hypothetical protein [Rhodococcus ruber]|uniref:hypothetical protein n=1 Tax=Rhodococcus ruber TaxID=1830 RepID=UPI0012678B9B|nr:hypothetical protein [Rhodococcus ruber]
MPEQTRVQVAIATDELRKWADWHADRGHAGVAHALYRSAERYDDQATALDRVREIADRAASAGWRQTPLLSVDQAEGMNLVGEEILRALDGDQ